MLAIFFYFFTGNSFCLHVAMAKKFIQAETDQNVYKITREPMALECFCT